MVVFKHDNIAAVGIIEGIVGRIHYSIDKGLDPDVVKDLYMFRGQI
jgi:hypothetical protein